jgi:protein SCO1/2
MAAALACGESGEQVPADAPWRGVVLDTVQARPDFVLRTTEGQVYDFRRETAGRPTLLFFGYTSCPDVCPVHLANIAAVLAKLPPARARELAVVFVTTDPKRDSAQRIRSWLDQFDRRFVGLLGAPKDVAAAQRAAGVGVAAGDTTAAEYGVAHAAQVIAISGDDSAHVVYPFGTRQDDWAADIPRLLDAWPATLVIRQAYVTSAAPDVAAFYAEFTNRGAVADTLTALLVPDAATAEVHGSVISGDVVRMGRRPLVIPAHGAAALEPGGQHGMLDGLRRRLAPGDTVEIELVFSKAGRRLVRAPVRRVGEQNAGAE